MLLALVFFLKIALAILNPFFPLHLKKKLLLIYNVVLLSGVEHNNSVIHAYMIYVKYVYIM